MNIFAESSQSLAGLFQLLGQPVRIQILLIIAREEACVCHIEAVLGLRQATISQNLMVLRNAGLVLTHRIGRNVFYYLANPGLLDSFQRLAETAGLQTGALAGLSARPVAGCPCPHCNPDQDPETSCQKIKAGKTKISE
jgi:DNA-binding transcriptional ArsR family regulator